MGWLNNIRNVVNRYVYLKNIAYLLLIVAGFVVIATFFTDFMSLAGKIIQVYDKFVIWTMVVTAGIGTTHALLKRTKEDNTFFLKFLNNAFIAAVFTAITYGVMINACFALSYIVLYDDKFMQNYPGIDKITMGTALILLMIGSLTGICKMIWEICKPPEVSVTTAPPDNNEERSQQEF